MPSRGPGIRPTSASAATSTKHATISRGSVVSRRFLPVPESRAPPRIRRKPRDDDDCHHAGNIEILYIARRAATPGCARQSLPRFSCEARQAGRDLSTMQMTRDEPRATGHAAKSHRPCTPWLIDVSMTAARGRWPRYRSRATLSRQWRAPLTFRAPR